LRACRHADAERHERECDELLLVCLSLCCRWTAATRRQSRERIYHEEKVGAVYDAHEMQRSPSKRWRKATEFTRVLPGHTRARWSNHCGLPIHQFGKVEDYVAAQETGRTRAITGGYGKESPRELTARAAARFTQRPDCQAFCRATKINPKLQLTHSL
jgi:hypothetical protein